MSKDKRLIVILGPTASGKSELAVKLAKKFNGEVVSADSRQVYKGLDIGAGKVPRDENPKSEIRNPKSRRTSPFWEKRRGLRGRQIQNSKSQNQKQPYFYKEIEHHLLDVASPKRIFTVAQYQKLAKKALQKIFKKGKIPIICGGTGFYIDALIYDYKFPEVAPQLKLRKQLEKKSIEELFQRLKKLDPRRAKNIDRHNKRRLIRALEIMLTTKKPIPPINTIINDNKILPYNTLKLGIKKTPKELKGLIAERLKKRLRQGLIKEVKNLHRQGLGWQRLDDLGLEYRYVSRYLRGLINKKEMVGLILKESWQYAKRQMTWFRRDKEIKWIKNEKEALRLLGKFLSAYLQ